MIAIPPIAPAQPPPVPSTPEEAQRVDRIITFAEFLGYQDDGKGGRIELWNLRKPVGRHPRGSTVSRQTLETLLFG